MECPHILENVKICTQNEKQPSSCCSVCKSSQNPWICLMCGAINCGRYVNAHAKSHHESSRPLHSVTMDCNSGAVFCYVCDEFVINDMPSGHIAAIRHWIQEFSTSKENRDTTVPAPHENHHHHPRRGGIAGGADTGTLYPPVMHKRRRTPSARAAAAAAQQMMMGKRQKTLSTESESKLRTSGIRNLGNTCFMNAVLQSLSNIQSFCGYIKQLPSLEHQVEKKKVNTRRLRDGEDVFVVEELRKTLVALWQGNKTAISPDSLFSVIWKVVPRFRGYQQQDAHEFMRYLLDRLHSELLTMLPYPNSSSPYIGPKGKSTIVTAIFGGILQNEVNCLICGTESKKHDPFLDLSLDIPSKFTAKSAVTKNGELRCDLTDCLGSFTAVEELEDSELYMCNSCKLKQKSTKKFWIRRLPNVLCLHLKRFRWQTCFRMKLDTFVHFPLRGLEMSRFVLNSLHDTRNSSCSSNQYDLAAVIVHHGSGAGSGHYTSYAVHDGHWYHFNDSTVTLCDEQTVVKCKAYILFYVRRNINVPECPTTTTNN